MNTYAPPAMRQLSPHTHTHLLHDFHQWIPMLGIALVVKVGLLYAFQFTVRDFSSTLTADAWMQLDLAKNIIAAILLAVFLALFIVRTLRRHPRHTAADAFRTGATWVGYTALFELGLGALTNTALDVFFPGLLSSYAWLLVPLTLTLAPVVSTRVHRPVKFEAVKKAPKRKRA